MEPTSAPAEARPPARAVPAPAELARTAVEYAGTGQLRIAWAAGIGPVPYVPDENGEPWLLLPAGHAAGWSTRGHDLTGVLQVGDAAPAGPVTVLVGGRLGRVAAEAQTRVAIALAGRRPLGALLDVGHGVALHHLRVEEVRLSGAVNAAVDLAGYGAARPDPVRPHASRVLAHLAFAHRRQLAGILYGHLGAEPGRAAAGIVPIGLDRYGLDLAYLDGNGQTVRTRVPFQAPIRCVAALGAALRAITPCACRAALAY